MADDKDRNNQNPASSKDAGDSSGKQEKPSFDRDAQDPKAQRARQRKAQADAKAKRDAQKKESTNETPDVKKDAKPKESPSPTKPDDVSDIDDTSPKNDVSQLHDKDVGMKDLAKQGDSKNKDKEASKEKMQEGADKVSSGAEKTLDGAQKTAEGATQAATGAGRVLAGDVSGAGDAVKGAKKTVDGAKETKEGIDEVKDGVDDIKEAKDGEGSKSDQKSTEAQPNLMEQMKSMKTGMQLGAAGGAGGAGTFLVHSALMLIEYLKLLALTGLQAVTNLLTSIVSMVTQAAAWLANITGLSAVVATIVTVSTIVTSTVTVIGGVVVSIQQTIMSQRDDIAVCQPHDDSNKTSSEWAVEGGMYFQQERIIEQAWSVFSEMDVSKDVAAGILGNFQYESGIDPTGVETIYDERYEIGPRKADAQSVNFDVHVIAPDYAARFPGVAKAKHVGIGLAQWTGGRNQALVNYAKDRGLAWHDIGTQLAFMFEGDDQSWLNILQDIINNSSSVEDATTRFLLEYERPAASARHTDERIKAAMQMRLKLDDITVDTAYAESILSKMNQDLAFGNHAVSRGEQDDGCGSPVKASFAGAHSEEWSGEVPNVPGHAWSPASMPAEIAKFASNPEDYGMTYGNGSGWALQTGSPGQCVAFSHAYMQKLYPGTTAPRGANGGQLAKAWSDAYSESLGGELSESPVAGAIFQYDNSGSYGHTGVVDHVFANGDLLIIEQNVSGLSGDNNNTPWTWSWRIVRVDSWQTSSGNSRNWRFWKPAKGGAEPEKDSTDV